MLCELYTRCWFCKAVHSPFFGNKLEQMISAYKSINAAIITMKPHQHDGRVIGLSHSDMSNHLASINSHSTEMMSVHLTFKDPHFLADQISLAAFLSFVSLCSLFNHLCFSAASNDSQPYAISDIAPLIYSSFYTSSASVLDSPRVTKHLLCQVMLRTQHSVRYTHLSVKDDSCCVGCGLLIYCHTDSHNVLFNHFFPVFLGFSGNTFGSANQ